MAQHLRVRVKVLKRQSAVGSGYLTANSYSTLSDKSLIKNFIGKDGIEHSLVNCFDFRPYKQAIATYALSETGASTVSLIGTAVDAGISPANNATISSDQTYYMSRIDSVVFDEFGDCIYLQRWRIRESKYSRNSWNVCIE